MKPLNEYYINDLFGQTTPLLQPYIQDFIGWFIQVAPVISTAMGGPPV